MFSCSDHYELILSVYQEYTDIISTTVRFITACSSYTHIWMGQQKDLTRNKLRFDSSHTHTRFKGYCTNAHNSCICCCILLMVWNAVRIKLIIIGSPLKMTQRSMWPLYENPLTRLLQLAEKEPWHAQSHFNSVAGRDTPVSHTAHIGC